MLRRSALLEPTTGVCCKRGAWRVVVAMGWGGDSPGTGAWVGSSAPASAVASEGIRPILPGWTDDRWHVFTCRASRKRPAPLFHRGEPMSDDRSMTSTNRTFLTPQDDGFDTARQAWNLAVDQRPAAVAY